MDVLGCGASACLSESPVNIEEFSNFNKEYHKSDVTSAQSKK
jgi:hypothetical protein